MSPLYFLAAAGVASLTLSSLVWPRAALAVALAVLLNLPMWASVDPYSAVPYTTVPILILAAVSIVNRGVRVAITDVLVVVMAGVILFVSLVEHAAFGSALTTFSIWLPAYALGRIFGARDRRFVMAAIAINGGVIGVMTILEFALGWHPFQHVWEYGTGYGEWSPIQYRGGVARSEWATGHSIVLGAVLGVAAAAAALWPSAPARWRWPFVAVISLAACLTLSRSAIVSLAVVAIVWALWGAGGTRLRRMAVLGILSSVALLGWRLVPGIGSDDAQGEMAASTEYRAVLLDTQLRQITPLGRTFQADRLSMVFAGSSSSVDNTFLALALSFGWVPAALLAAVIVIALVRSSKHDRPAAAMLYAAVPPLLVASMLNQYQVIFFLVLGYACSSPVQSSLSGRSSIDRLQQFAGARGPSRHCLVPMHSGASSRLVGTRSLQMRPGVVDGELLPR